ncbi:hypothetical protein G5C51_16695 [Streptomyces sp. A7024]|uniref:Uncharacterized protein n=1 Tax=Streptomyces coryli TaxID=1128680 RepID=A0A6G4TZU3_9ACTN|nr:hypothetical protein [Streptomyces coryli]NGN65529.1 hypothetical protein [Streptomyces coryli]
MASAAGGPDPPPPVPAISAEAIQAYLVEYQQCMESYRHTYATIWQASGLFAAIGAGLLTLGKGSHIELIAPVPIIFWYLGVFMPLNRYGEMRNDRLAEIEERLSEAIPGLDMQHYRGFSNARKSMTTMQRVRQLQVIKRPRVSEVVTAFGVAMLTIEAYGLVRLIV